jgi:hypothetical protein
LNALSRHTTANLRPAADERARLDPSDTLLDVFSDVAESFKSEWWSYPCLQLDLPLHVVVGEGEHAAVAMVDQDDFLSPQETLRDNEGADRILCHDPACVADDVGIAVLEAENLVNVKAGVHTGQDGKLLTRQHRKIALGKGTCVSIIVVEQRVGYAHS